MPDSHRGPDPGRLAQGGAHDARPEILDAVAQALANLRYGVIQLTIHDGRPVQIDITERRRFA